MRSDFLDGSPTSPRDRAVGGPRPPSPPPDRRSCGPHDAPTVGRPAASTTESPPSAQSSASSARTGPRARPRAAFSSGECGMATGGRRRYGRCAVQTYRKYPPWIRVSVRLQPNICSNPSGVFSTVTHSVVQVVQVVREPLLDRSSLRHVVATAQPLNRSAPRHRYRARATAQNRSTLRHVIAAAQPLKSAPRHRCRSTGAIS